MECVPKTYETQLLSHSLYKGSTADNIQVQVKTQLLGSC